MRTLANKIKIMGMVLGLTALSYISLKAQETELKIKTGLKRRLFKS